MPKQNQAVEAKPDTKSQSQVDPVVAAELDYELVGLSRLPGGLIGRGGTGSIQAQAARLGDPHLQTAQRQALAAQIGRRQGNRHLQRVVRSLTNVECGGNTRGLIQYRLSPAAIARDVVTETTARTRRARTWPGLPESRYPAIIRAIMDDDQEGALTQMVTALRLPLDRVTVQLTDVLGIPGVRQPSGEAGSREEGMHIPYVVHRPQCDSPPAGQQHWQTHQPDDVRAYLQVNRRIFHPPPSNWRPDLVDELARKRMTKLYTTLMHEFTHYQQQFEEGFSQHTQFLRRGNLEFLRLTLQPRLVEKLNEIDANSAEIENAARTALTLSLEIRNVVSYLWDSYVSYHSLTEQNVDINVDIGVARRVYRNIQRARRLLRAYLNTDEGRSLPYDSEQRQFMIDNECPRRYRPEWIEPIVRGGGS
jgi:hypothetical protein